MHFQKPLPLLAALALSACATQPDQIQTSYVSDLQYQKYTCSQLSAEAGRVSRRASELHGTLKKTADNDSAQMAVGMILFWPTLFFLEGGDGPQAQEYARLKGEREAIEKVSVQKDCALKFAPVAPTEVKKDEGKTS